MSLLIGAGAVVVIGLLLFGRETFAKLRVLTKGFASLFIKDIAATPEGAAAIYEEAINEAQKHYNEASDAFLRIAGKLRMAHNDMEKKRKELANAEKQCKMLVDAGRDADAEIIAQDIINLQEYIEKLQGVIDKLIPAQEEAKKLMLAQEAQLRKLKAEKQSVISSMKMNKQIKELYDGLDELKNTKALDKMLSSVKEKANELEESAVGAKVVHESKLSTKVANVYADSKKLSAADYVKSLKKPVKQSVEQQTIQSMRERI